MSKKKQDASVNSVAVEVNENTEVQNGKGSTFVVTVVNDSIQGMHEWTEEETNLLKQAVEADGGQFNWDVIASAVPSKDINQVKAYVMSMQQPENQANQTANVIKAPIEIWTDLAQKLTSEDDKAASVCLPQLMMAAAAEPVNAPEVGKPNYSQIYIYLSSLLNGETPPSLPPRESSVVLNLIQDIVDKIRTSDVSGQMHYLSDWHKQFQSENELNDKSTKKSDDDDDDDDDGTDDNGQSPSTAPPPLKRTSSGRIVKQRVGLGTCNDYNVNKMKKPKKSPPPQPTVNVTPPTPPRPRPTSLNPFRIPVNLLNFKQTQTTLVARQKK